MSGESSEFGVYSDSRLIDWLNQRMTEDYIDARNQEGVFMIRIENPDDHSDSSLDYLTLGSGDSLRAAIINAMKHEDADKENA